MTDQTLLNNPTGASNIEVHTVPQSGLIAFKPYLDELGYLIAEYKQKESRFKLDLKKMDLFTLLKSGQAESMMESGALWRTAAGLQKELSNLSAFTTKHVHFFMKGKFDLLEEQKRQMARDMAYGGAEETKDNQIQFRATNRLLAELRRVHNRVEAALNQEKAQRAA